MNWLSIVHTTKRVLSLPRYASLVVRLARDVRVPVALKAGALILALMIVSPFDLLGDIPVIGMLDDAALLFLLADLFVRFCPHDVVVEHQAAVGLLKNVTPKPN